MATPNDEAAEKGKKAVRLVIDNAEEIAAPTGAPSSEDPMMGGAPPAGGAPIHFEPPRDRPSGPPGKSPPRNGYGLPEGCPVTPLGIADDVFFYLDASHQLRALKARDHSRLGVQALFGIQIGALYVFWPRLSGGDEPIVTGWRPEKAAEELMGAAARRGVWNAFERVRGAGAWCGDDGELILHCGDNIWQGPKPGEHIAGIWHKPGLIGRYVYPADSPGPRPASQPAAGGDGGAAHSLLALFSTWNWHRAEVDPMLLLGWVGAAMIGGALDWRPAAWLTGDKGTGKSTLQKAIARIFDGALISVSDASAAGIWQKLGHRTVPVGLDEIEADDDNRKSSAIIKLARLAASGGLVLRGGADHQGTEFVARNCFLFSSINVPPLQSQDRSRIAILELGKLVESRVPSIEPVLMRTLGAQLRRRLVDGWPRYGDTLEQYRGALAKVGHSARGADQFGTLMAIADLLLHDLETTSDCAEAWALKLRATDMAEVGDDASDQDRAASFLLTSIIDPFRNGGRHTIAEWIRDACDVSAAITEPKEANRTLQTFGLKIMFAEAGEPWLAIANYHQGLAQLYERTHWAGRPGTQGGWVQAWRRLEGARVLGKTAYFAGQRSKCVVVPLRALMPDLPKPKSLTLDGDLSSDDFAP